MDLVGVRVGALVIGRWFLLHVKNVDGRRLEVVIY